DHCSAVDSSMRVKLLMAGTLRGHGRRRGAVTAVGRGHGAGSVRAWIGSAVLIDRRRERSGDGHHRDRP
ncbi:MAG TPA: hypothetical protein PKE56_14230, partial [Acidimicrobiales bacterium]|nr:hypothetical protein [Acidimicrobiales bacterium]